MPARPALRSALDFGPADAIYLVTPDRFANGSPANDQVKGMPDTVQRKSDVGRHGGDLQGIANHLDYIAGMGFTQLWLNPVLENNQPDTTYHGYAITDFYRVDARFGSNESYRQLGVDARAARHRLDHGRGAESLRFGALVDARSACARLVQ